MISEILELFVNTLTADDKYSLRNRAKLTQLSKKWKKSYKVLKFASSFKLFEKKDKPQIVRIFEIRDCNRPG